jgi:O-antigen ligase
MLRPYSIGVRLEIWRDTLSGLTLLGHGLGSFRHLFPYLTNHFDGAFEVVDHPHNELLEIWFETGAIGLFIFAGWIAVALRSADDVARSIIVCWLVAGCIAFPSHIPFTLFMAALALGHAGRGGLPIRILRDNGRLRIQVGDGHQCAIAATG